MDQLFFFCIVVTAFNLFLIIYAFTLPLYPESWRKKANHISGSWWPEWEKWINSYSGNQVEARKEGSTIYPPLYDAPGSYVLKKS